MTEHPLEGFGFSFGNFKCFGDEHLGSFGLFSPINILIRRNNSGKSAMLDALEIFVSKGKYYRQDLHSRGSKLPIWHVLKNIGGNELVNGFSKHFSSHVAQKFSNSSAIIEANFSQSWTPEYVGGIDDCFLREVIPDFSCRDQDLVAVTNYITSAYCSSTPQADVRRIAAERSVTPEGEAPDITMTPGGRGVTNAIRSFILNHDLDRKLVEEKMRDSLNKIYQGDAYFSEIGITYVTNGKLYEIILSEETKGEIKLSQSGSSLQSIFLILCLLQLIPISSKPVINYGKLIICLEEPENNLHPSLLRRLLNFLAEQRMEKKFMLVITTHSPVCIDWASKREDAKIIHVKQREGMATTIPSSSYIAKRSILDDLDVRASDLLQANGIIWVEGPSDRIYIRRWIDLLSDGALQEDVHYTIMFYGGKLLSHVKALPPEEAGEQISLLSINRNAAILIDSDRKKARGVKKPRMNINSTKSRIRDEISRINGFIWVTEGKEIENYIHPDVLGEMIEQSTLSIDMYESIVEHKKMEGFNKNKIRLAHEVTDRMKAEHLTHLDLRSKLCELESHIKEWNDIG